VRNKIWVLSYEEGVPEVTIIWPPGISLVPWRPPTISSDTIIQSKKVKRYENWMKSGHPGHHDSLGGER
jgi:hypothetical protein